MSPLLSLGMAIARNAALRRRAGSGLPANPERYRIAVRDGGCRDRVEGILRSFFTGFECGLRETREACPEPAAAVLEPFFHEGRAMGRAGRASCARGGLARLIEDLGRGDESFVFLRAVGVGFWLGFRFPGRPDRVEVMARKAGALGDLILDGAGFKIGFFDLAKIPAEARPSRAMQLSDLLSRRGQDAFWNGVGRSLWFFGSDDPSRAFGEARSFGPAVKPVLGGMGLAAAFTFPDDLRRARAAAELLGPDERPCFEKGIRIALYVRDHDQPGELEKWLAALPDAEAARTRSDLALAREVGAATRSREDFIPAFHAGCFRAWERGLPGT